VFRKFFGQAGGAARQWRVASVAAVSVGIFALSALTNPATAEAKPVAADAASSRSATCAVLLGKSEQGKTSPVVSQTCSSDPNAPQLQAVAATDTLLLEAFQNANNNPAATVYRYYGQYGPCDSAGYKWNVPVGWLGVFSGFDTSNDCNVVTGYSSWYETDDNQTWDGSSNVCGCVVVGWVGDFMNDRISSWWARRG
jgi:hypothetical protein